MKSSGAPATLSSLGAQASSANLTTLAAVTPGASGLVALAAANAAALRSAASLGTAAVEALEFGVEFKGAIGCGQIGGFWKE